jgi:hypothetical protein
MPPSTMRSATTASSLAWGMLSKYFDRSASMTWGVAGPEGVGDGVQPHRGPISGAGIRT